jgi:hypothetical protein
MFLDDGKLNILVSKITSDGGLVAYRELDETLGLTGMVDDLFRDRRNGGSAGIMAVYGSVA